MTFPSALEAVPRAAALDDGPGPAPSTLRQKMVALVDSVLSPVVERMQSILVGPTQYDVEGYPQATFDDRFAAASTDAHSGGGVIVVPPKTNYVSSTGLPAITKPSVSWSGPGGSRATRILLSGSGDLARVRMSLASSGDDAVQAGGIRGLTLQGTSSSAARGLHMGDVVGFTVHDVAVLGFSGAGSRGIWMDNTNRWCEQCEFTDVWIYDCETHLAFTVNGGNQSFGYNKWDGLRMNIKGGQTGFWSQDAAYIYHGNFRMKANVEGDGQIGFVDDGSFWDGTAVDIKAEHNGAGTGVGIEVASGAALNVWGVVKTAGMGHINHNAASLSPTFLIRGSGEAITDGQFNDLSSGQMVNTFNPSTTVQVAQLMVSDRNNPYGGFGMLNGVGSAVHSPMVWMFDDANNAFVIYALAFGAAPHTMREIARFDSYGGFLLRDSLVPPVTPSDGGYFFADAGAIKWKGSGGTVTTVAPA